MDKWLSKGFCLVLGLIVGTSMLSQGKVKGIRTPAEHEEYITKYNACETLKRLCARVTRNEIDISQNADDIATLQGE